MNPRMSWLSSTLLLPEAFQRSFEFHFLLFWSLSISRDQILNKGTLLSGSAVICSVSCASANALEARGLLKGAALLCGT